MIVELEVVGQSRRFAWFRVPLHVMGMRVILTMPRKTLPRGMASATLVEVELDPESVHHTGHGWVADMEVLDDKSSDTGSSGA